MRQITIIDRLLLLATGAVVFTTILWAGPSHTFQGNNWIEILDGTLLFAGGLLFVGGLGLLARPAISRLLQSAAKHSPQKVRPSR